MTPSAVIAPESHFMRCWNGLSPAGINFKLHLQIRRLMNPMGKKLWRTAHMRQTTEITELRRLQSIVFLFYRFRLLGVRLSHHFLQFFNWPVIAPGRLLIRRCKHPFSQTVFWIGAFHALWDIFNQSGLFRIGIAIAGYARFPFNQPLRPTLVQFFIRISVETFFKWFNVIRYRWDWTT